MADIFYRPEFEIVAVADKSEERARLAAEKYGVLIFGTDYRAFA